MARAVGPADPRGGHGARRRGPGRLPGGRGDRPGGLARRRRRRRALRRRSLRLRRDPAAARAPGRAGGRQPARRARQPLLRAGRRVDRRGERAPPRRHVPDAGLDRSATWTGCWSATRPGSATRPASGTTCAPPGRSSTVAAGTRRCRRAPPAPYPEPLRRAIVARNRPLLADNLSSFAAQLEKALARGDAVSASHRAAAFLASYFDVLFALNRATHPGEKRLLRARRASLPAPPAGARRVGRGAPPRRRYPWCPAPGRGPARSPGRSTCCWPGRGSWRGRPGRRAATQPEPPRGPIWDVHGLPVQGKVRASQRQQHQTNTTGASRCVASPSPSPSPSSCPRWRSPTRPSPPPTGRAPSAPA